MIIKKTILQKKSLLQRVNREKAFVKKIIIKPRKIFSKIEEKISPNKSIGVSTHLLNKTLKQTPQKGIKKNSSYLERTLMPSGSVNTLDGYWKNKYEKFLGVSLPNIRVHYDHNAIEKTQKYKARSFAQGANIYLGKDIKPIDTLEGQMTMAHELTHVLQQKYLDMSSGRKEMIDPNIELEKRAKGVEGIVKFRRGIDQTASALIKSRNLLPFRSYNVPMFEGNKYLAHNIIQRQKDFFDSTKANLLNADNKDNIFIDANTKYFTYRSFLTRKEFKNLSEEAKATGMTIEIRKLSKEARKHRNSNSLPKPMSIKSKTLGKDDLTYLSGKKFKKRDIAKVAIYNPNILTENEIKEKIKKRELRGIHKVKYSDMQQRVKDGLRVEVREQFLNEIKLKNSSLSEVEIIEKLETDKKISASYQEALNRKLKKFNFKNKRDVTKKYTDLRTEDVHSLMTSRVKDFKKHNDPKNMTEDERKALSYSIGGSDAHGTEGLVKSRDGKTFTSDLDIHSVTYTNKNGKKVDNLKRAYVYQDEASRKKSLRLMARLIEKEGSGVEHFATKQSWYTKIIKNKMISTSWSQKAGDTELADTNYVVPKDKEMRFTINPENSKYNPLQLPPSNKKKSTFSSRMAERLKRYSARAKKMLKYTKGVGGKALNYSKIIGSKALSKGKEYAVKGKKFAGKHVSSLGHKAKNMVKSAKNISFSRKDFSISKLKPLKNLYDKHHGGGSLKGLQDKYKKTKEFTTKLMKGKLEIGDVDEALQFASKHIDSDKLKNISKKFESEKFKKFSKKLKGTSKFASKLKKASDIKKLLSGEASASDAIGLTKDGLDFA